MGAKEYYTPPRFGQFVVASVGTPVDKETARNQVGMVVGFDELTRAVYVKFRQRSSYLVRDSFHNLDDKIGFDAFMREYDDYAMEMDDDDIESETAVGVLLRDQLLELVDIEEEDDFELGEGNTNHMPQTIQNTTLPEAEDNQDIIIETEEGPRRSSRQTRSNRLPDYVYAMIDNETVDWVEQLEIIHGLVEDAKIQGEVGKRAAAKIELDRVWRKYKAIRPIKLEDKSIAKEIIKGKLLEIEKKDTAHNFQRHKARIVARGDMRKNKPKEIKEVFSPTVAYPTVLTMLNVIIDQGYDWMIVDVESAYLNSEYQDGIYMRLDPRVAEIMVELDETVNEFLEPDGSMYVKIQKALYGLQESAKLWYETLGDHLKSFGLIRSSYDHALYWIRIESQLLFILVYVDDMLIAGPRQAILEMKSKLESVFSINASEMSPKQFDYVGINVTYDASDKSFEISQPGMIKKITDGVEGESELPCDGTLFKPTDDTPYADVTEYRSKLMECYYLAKTRYDIKIALGYLATKSQAPTLGDRAKLKKLQQYLSFTADMKLRIKPVGGMQVRASADASFGTFMDGKSNTGLALTIGAGNAPVMVKSVKQKSVANSSTTAELIAFSTALEETLWLVELLTELGFKQEPVVIEQDNQSTMKLIEKGPSSSGRTKWINVKQFWVNEHLSQGTIKLEYVPSLDLLADGLTKPLGRKAFYRWRARMLNSKEKEV
jgi:Reverse transcriptase (RNA-dependent DNA polymerase)